MKNIILFVASLSLFACEKYEQPSLLTLGGTYQINKIEIINITNISTSIIGLDTFVNNSGTLSEDTIWSPLGPNDTIFLGRTTWMLDELKIYMRPRIDTTISNYPINWDDISYYTTFGQTYYTLGILRFTHLKSSKTIILKILEDNLESLVFEQEFNNSRIRYYLIRVGP